MTTMHVQLNTTPSGFISQECPSCVRRFQVQLGRGSHEPLSYCPYCGHRGHDCWWTNAQAKYLAAAAGNAVVSPMLEKMARDFNRRSRGGFISMKMSTTRPRVPPPPAEVDELSPIRFTCCNEVVRYEGASVGLYCIICGATGTTAAA